MGSEFNIDIFYRHHLKEEIFFSCVLPNTHLKDKWNVPEGTDVKYLWETLQVNYVGTPLVTENVFNCKSLLSYGNKEWSLQLKMLFLMFPFKGFQFKLLISSLNEKHLFKP